MVPSHEAGAAHGISVSCGLSDMHPATKNRAIANAAKQSACLRLEENHIAFLHGNLLPIAEDVGYHQVLAAHGLA